MSKVTETVLALARPVAEAEGCEVWDVEYVKEAGEWFLRVYIDKEGGISIDDCEAVSRPLSDLLDEADPIEGSYTFEVSSAGADRVLKKPEHFARFQQPEFFRPVDDPCRAHRHPWARANPFDTVRLRPVIPPVPPQSLSGCALLLSARNPLLKIGGWFFCKQRRFHLIKQRVGYI